MPAFIDSFQFRASPFEQYVAENEPEIDEYAVRPPYFVDVANRANAASSFILFGYRGSGKSATRLTGTKELWKRIDQGESVPLPVTFTDFDPILREKKVDAVTAVDLIDRIVFLAIEALLLWLSKQETRDDYIACLDEEEATFVKGMVLTFYLAKPDNERRVSERQAMTLLHQTWRNRTAAWVQKRWEIVSSIVARVADGLARSHAQSKPIENELKDLLAQINNTGGAVLLLENVARLARIFGFTGITVLVDKIDENTQTQQSAENAAALVYPLLSQVQYLEIDGFGWIFFLWDRVKLSLRENDKYFVRLDKIAFSDIAWEDQHLASMLHLRIRHFSGGTREGLGSVCEPNVNVEGQIGEMIGTAMRSPRELIRLMDVVIREHNREHAHKIENMPLNSSSFLAGQDVYVKDTLWNLYDRKILSQILRLGLVRFVNKDVQTAFKMGDNAARNRVRNWENCGAIRLSGTRAAEGEGGGKPANEYSISDTRIVRMMQRKLFDPEMLAEADPAESP